MDGLRLWFASTTDIELRPEQYHPTLRGIITQQNRIGWKQLFLGRFGIAWSQHQTRHYMAHGEEDDGLDRSGLQWQSNLIQFVWDRWYVLWRSRNQEIHGHDERTRQEASKRKVRQELHEIYQNRSMYDTNVQNLLHQDAEEHARQPLRITKNWIAINKPIFRESYNRVKKRAGQGMKSIREYFKVL
ncbi:hypothetical protein MHU86_3854 [Fragilaria crotonensis]|nr:hypothetical protein MHU86_3854 [Fragilaria crotonensis]